MRKRGKTRSWGRTFHFEHDVVSLRSIPERLPVPESKEKVLLAHAFGRSYGDVGLNDGGTLIETKGLNHFLTYDRENGILRCEGGTSLGDILKLIAPDGWFLPVTPGTQFVSLAGAVANDVHGKNHHIAGTIGQHIRRIGLLRSDGKHYELSRDEESDLFRATIGGLGLTGLITWVEINLLAVKGQYVSRDTVKFASLGEFLEISQDSDTRFDYTVAWLDTLSRQGRGLFFRGNHVHNPARQYHPLSLTVPFTTPEWLLNHATVRVFNELYFRRQRKKREHRVVHYQPFFYPLDAIKNWNKLYGRRGFYQYQFVLEGEEKFRAVLARILNSAESSFLAVLKKFGNQTSPGMLSFPAPGLTLALDFPNHGSRTHKFLCELDHYVCELGGRAYPAKDAVMDPVTFNLYYPNWREFLRYKDPMFSSSFWRRVCHEQ